MLLSSVLLACLIVCESRQWTLTTSQKRSIDGYILGMRYRCPRSWPTGFAVSITTAEEQLFVKGYGKEDLTTDKKVKPQTRFPIGSNSKAFTSTLIAILIEKGVRSSKNISLAWDTPIVEYLGDDFELYDCVLTSRTTLRDLMLHRTGITVDYHQILAGYSDEVTKQDYIRSLRHFRPEVPFRTEPLYSSHMFNLAAYVAEVVTGEDISSLLRRYIFEPLNMTSTGTIMDGDIHDLDIAKSYAADRSGEMREVDLEILLQAKFCVGAGGIVSTPVDLGKWMRMHLNNGSPLLSPNALKTLHGTNPSAPTYRELTSGWDDLNTAGLGWFKSNHSGLTMVFHSGAISTFKSHLWMYPDMDLAISVLSNGPPTLSTTYFLYHLMDSIMKMVLRNDIFSRVPRPCYWEQTEIPENLEDRPLDYDMESFTGQYDRPGYSSIHVSINGSSLLFTRGAYFHGQLVYTGKELEFRIKFLGLYEFVNALPVPEKSTFNFIADEAGGILTLVLHVGGKTVKFIRHGYPHERQKSPNEEQCMGNGISL